MRICSAPQCESLLGPKDGPMCQTHVYRFKRYGCYDLPPRTPKRQPEYLMACKVHGQLKKEQIQFRERKGAAFSFVGQNCLECVRICGVANRYRLTVKEYQAMHEEQQGKCAICLRPERRIANGRVTRLAVDHCHKSAATGAVKIRGLLCFKCDAAIGSFEDNIDYLNSAVEYLKQE